jgi:hypothetical protein
MLGVLYACLGLIFLPFFAVAGMLGAFAQQAQNTNGLPAAVIAGVMLGFGIFIPIIYGVMGFVLGIVTAAIYNVVASWIGGIEVEVE